MQGLHPRRLAEVAPNRSRTCDNDRRSPSGRTLNLQLNHPSPAMTVTISTKTLVAATVCVFLGAACTQLDQSTGWIKPTPGVPKFEPAAWGGAYKVTFRNVPFKPSDTSLPSWPYAPPSNHDTFKWSTQGFDTTPATSVNATFRWSKEPNCFWKNNTDGTFDVWFELPGLTFDANCYCYALNRLEGARCEPGSSKGNRSRDQWVDKMTCKALNQAMADDGAVPVSREKALSGQPDWGHYVAIVGRLEVWIPDHSGIADFHAMRKDTSGTWSYKFDLSPAADRDFDGKPIKDPEPAPLPGHYFVCGYYQVDPTKVPTGAANSPPGETGPLLRSNFQADSEIARYRKNTKTTIDISPVPYNPTTDALIEPAKQSVLDEDAAWERKRGTKEYEEWKQKQLEALEVKPQAPAGDSKGAGRGSKGSDNSKAATGRRLSHHQRLMVV